MAKCVLTWVTMMMLQGTGDSLKCFECDTNMNPACGVNFKTYQYSAEYCPGYDYKCGLQRQHPKGDYIGIIRACYPLGSLGLEDESDGCHELWNNEYNTTLLFCLCSEDYCNDAAITTPNVILSILLLVLSIVTLKLTYY